MMKPLNFYIKESIVDEKLDINKVRLDNSAPFPIDGGLKKLVQFLIANGFSEIEDIGDFDFYVEKYNSMKTKAYSTNGSDIRFADTTYDTISKDNPIFVIDTWTKNMYTEVDNWWQNKLKPKEFCKKLEERLEFRV